MSAVAQTPGDRACRYAMGAETVLYAYAAAASSDLAWGLHMLAEEAAADATSAIEGDDLQALEALSLRYCKANAVIAAIAHEAGDDMLFAGEALMEATKEMIDAEVDRRMSAKAVQP